MSQGRSFLLTTIQNGGIQASGLDTRISRGKLAVNGCHVVVAIFLPVLHLLTQVIHSGDIVFQPLPCQHRELNLGDIEPGRMLGRVMDLQSIQQLLGVSRRKGVVQGGRRMRVEVVHHQDHVPDPGIMQRQNFFDKAGPVFFRAALGDLEIALAPPGVHRQ